MFGVLRPAQAEAISGFFRALRLFDVSMNKLTGQIPDNYTDWDKLQVRSRLSARLSPRSTPWCRCTPASLRLRN